MSKEIITIGIADDHQMMRQGIVSLINKNKHFKVILEAKNGSDLLDKIKTTSVIPSILLIDIVMPIMDGFETISCITKKYPDLKCIALSVNGDFISAFKMIKNGARAYIKKDCSTEQLFKTISMVNEMGIYYDSFVVSSLLEYESANPEEKATKKSLVNELSEREKKFISISCSDLTYKEVADQMGISKRTVDTFRESVFDKINVKSRVGMVIYAIRNGIYKL